MGNSSVRAALVLILTFAAGAAAGVAGDRLWLAPDRRAVGPDGTAPDTAEPTEERRDPGEHPERPRTTIERFADDLGLTTEQRARIEEILSRHREEMHRMWSEIRPRFRSLVDSARADIEAVLSPDQVEHYRRLLRRRHEGWEEKEGGRADPDSADSAGAPATRPDTVAGG